MQNGLDRRIIKAFVTRQTRWNFEWHSWDMPKPVLDPSVIWNALADENGWRCARSESPLGGRAQEGVDKWLQWICVKHQFDKITIVVRCAVWGLLTPPFREGNLTLHCVNLTVDFLISLKDTNILSWRKSKVAWYVPRCDTSLCSVLTCRFFLPSDFGFLLILFPSSLCSPNNEYSIFTCELLQHCQATYFFQGEIYLSKLRHHSWIHRVYISSWMHWI